MDRDYHQQAGVAVYAVNLGFTPTHLARCCKKTCGKPALSLLNIRIFFEAHILLRNSKVPIHKIAADLGFSSSAYFARAFQANTSLTPSQLRKKGPLEKV
ncbi:MAG: helix-turn-helix domain-containing protein [Octadecabacter sp.]|nr:helix-turn-helix domain-containing protein [Octadecabacter sp.]